MYYRVKGITKKEGIVYSNIVTIESGEQTQQLKVYPNPVKDFNLNIELFKNVQSNIEVAIYTISGQRLYYNQFGAGQHIRFTVPDIFESSTIYILKVIFDQVEVVEKIVFE